MKKQLCLTLLFLFGISLASFAQEARTVAVTAEKEVDIQNNDVAAARTVALAMATRAAVEKAYGTYVNVQQLPEGRQILAKAAAGLQYKILAEQQRGNKYSVKIQASVLVPAEYIHDTSEERENMGDQMKSFVQKYPQGEINWGDGFVLAFGKGEITDASAANAEEMAARAAEVDAKAHLLEIINDIPVDSEMKAGENKKVSFALEGFVQGAEVVTRSKNGTTVNVTVQAPIRGVKGLSMTILGYYTPPPPPPPPPTVAEKQPTPEPKPPEKKPEKKPTETKPPEVKPEVNTNPPEAQPKTGTEGQAIPTPEPQKQPSTQSYTGVVIDARKTSATPALFPTVKDTQNQDVYNVSQANKDDLQNRGMASYAVVSRDASISKLFPHAALVVQASFVPADQTPKPTAQPAVGQKRRQGYKPLVISAADASGKLKANLIISEADAKKLRELDQKTNTLKQCRVVVVVSSEVGGVEGKLLFLQF
jgi:hypothetical protein